jgi:hypothetical protein
MTAEGLIEPGVLDVAAAVATVTSPSLRRD